MSPERGQHQRQAKRNPSHTSDMAAENGFSKAGVPQVSRLFETWDSTVASVLGFVTETRGSSLQ
jgi:hypothetical protein